MGLFTDAIDWLAGPLWDQDKGGGGPNLLEQDFMMSQMSGMGGMGIDTEFFLAQQMAQQAMMMETMLAIAGMQNQPSMLEMPEIVQVPDVDFGEQAKKLSRQATGQVSQEMARKKGVANTVFTPSLLDDEDAYVTGSPITR